MTTLEQRKENADILIQYANGGSFTVKSRVELKGCKRYENGNYEVSSSRLAKLRTQYKVECDF